MKTTRAKRKRTVKAVSMDTDLARWLEGKAREENRAVSNFVETILERRRQEEGANQVVPA